VSGLLLPLVSLSLGASRALAASGEGAAAAGWGAAFLVWLLTGLLGLVGLALITAVRPRPPGWQIFTPRILGLALYGWLHWILVTFGLLSHSRFSALFSFLLLVIPALAVLVAARRRLASLWRERRRLLLLSEGVFALVFVGFLLLKAYSPDIELWERPSEFAYYNALDRSESLPPPDPWLSGEPLNYYYYGWFFFVSLGKVAGIPTTISYNLGVPVTVALTALGALAFQCCLTGSLGAALFGTGFLLFFGNYDAWRQVWVRRKFFPFNWFQSAHSPIRNTISEFPFWSYLYGDLHPHIIVLPFTLLVLALLVAAIRKHSRCLAGVGPRPAYWRTALLLVLVLGTVYAVHPWEMPLYGGITGLLLFGLGVRRRLFAPEGAASRLRALGGGLRDGALPLVGAVGIFLPYLLGFNRKPPLSLGLTWEVGEKALRSYTTRLDELLLVFGFFLCLGLLAGLLHLWQRVRRSGARALLPGLGAAVGLVLLGLGAAEALSRGGLSGAVAQRSLLPEGSTLPVETDYAVGLLLAGLGLLLVRVVGSSGAGLERRFTFFASGLAFLIVAGDEFVYLRDFLGGGDWRRMNSVFKFHFQAWILLALATPALLRLPLVWGGQRRSPGGRWKFLAFLVFLSALLPPAVLAGRVRTLPLWWNVALGVLLAGCYLLWVLAPSPRGPARDSCRLFRAGAGAYWSVITALLVPGLLFAVVGTNQRIRERSNAKASRPTLDGLAFRAKVYPDEFAAISWLRREVRGQPVILECTGSSYKHYSRYSMNTGLPTLLGWSSHIVSKGFDWKEVFERRDAIDTIYRAPLSLSALRQLRRYQVSYVIVGRLERQEYPPSSLGLFETRPDLYEAAFRSGDTVIYRVADRVRDGDVSLSELAGEGQASRGAATAQEPAAGRAADASVGAGASMFQGGFGSAPGKFYQARAIAVDARGNVFVADFRNNRVQKFAADGRFLAAWGESGKNAGQFNDPCGIAVDGAGNVIVADTWNQRLQRFTPDGRWLSSIPAPAVGWFAPREVAVDARGHIWVADTGYARIHELGPDGRHLRVFGGKGDGPGKLNEPVGLAPAPDGRLFVADTGNRRIVVFSRAGEQLAEFPVPEWHERSEAYLALDREGLLYASLPDDGKVLRIDPGSGRRLAVSSGPADERMVNPSGLALAPSGALYVMDRGANRVWRLDLEGDFDSQSAD
jgi:YYY domain-containing protein